MIITEQWIKKHKRRYYRGLNPTAHRQFDDLYLTTKRKYAVYYAGRIGKVFECILKENSNIFNLKCITDECNLRNYIKKNNVCNHILNLIPELKERDWSAVLRGDDARQELIDIIKNLEYDGYFNYEWDDISLQTLMRKYHSCYLDKSNSPSIALFNPNAIIITNQWKVKELPEWEEIKTHEKHDVEHYVYDLLEDDKDIAQVLHTEIVNRSEHYLTLNKDDIYDIIFNLDIDPDVIEKHQSAVMNSFLKRFGEAQTYKFNKKQFEENLKKLDELRYGC